MLYNEYTKKEWYDTKKTRNVYDKRVRRCSPTTEKMDFGSGRMNLNVDEQRKNRTLEGVGEKSAD